MFERLKSGQEDLKTKTQDHLDVSFIQTEINFVRELELLLLLHIGLI